MNKITQLITAVFFGCFCQTAFAKPSINNMQSCQGLLDYLEIRLKDAPSDYPTDKVNRVREALNQYNKYIQKEIVSPGLLQFNAGDANKANAMQLKVDDYKETLVKSYTSRFNSPRLVTDFAISVNNCAKEAVPSGSALEELKYAINTLVELAQLNP